MRKLSSAMAVLIACTVLAACSAPTAPAAGITPTPTTPSATPSPTPTIDPGPVALTVADAGERYLDIVCERNAGVAELADLIEAGEDKFLSGGDPSMKKISKSAAASMKVARMNVKLFDDPYYVWPDTVAEHVSVVRDSYMTEVSTLSAIANSDDYADAYYADWGDQTAASTAAQEVRYQLDLDPDTTTSCKGRGKNATALFAEMTERDEYLASFASED